MRAYGSDGLANINLKGGNVHTGHVFVVRGDMTQLACDAWLLPTDENFSVTALWSGAVGLTQGYLRDQPRWTDDERVRLYPREDGSGSPQVWLGRVGLVKPSIDWYLQCVESFVREATRHVAPEPGRPALLAINHVGTGNGGARFTKGDLLTALFERLQGLARELAVDVVVVSFDERAHAAAQRARQRSLGGSRFDSVEEAIRHWAFESADRTSMLQDQARMLADKIRRNQLALFLGAGVSVGARLPGWRELIRQLADGLREPIALSDLERLNDDRDRAALLEKRFKAEGRALADELVLHLGRSRYSLQHGLLSSLQVTEVITTNFDELFEAAARTDSRPLTVLPGSAIDGGNRWLLKLHGTLSEPESLVFTRAAYLEAPRQRGALFGLVQAMLMTRHMLFVGYGLADEDFHDLVHEVRHAQTPERGTNSLGSAITLFEDPIHAELWRGDVGVTAMCTALSNEDQSDPVVRAARKRAAGRDVERFLDLVGMLSTDRAAFLLDPDYAGMLTDSELRLVELLTPLTSEAGSHRYGDGWVGLTDLLQRFGHSFAPGRHTEGTGTSAEELESDQVSFEDAEVWDAQWDELISLGRFPSEVDHRILLGDLVPEMGSWTHPVPDPIGPKSMQRLLPPAATWAHLARLDVDELLGLPQMGGRRLEQMIDRFRLAASGKAAIPPAIGEGAAAEADPVRCASNLLAEFTGRDIDVLRRVIDVTGRAETLEQIGQRLGLTRERVRQLETKVRQRLSGRAVAADMVALQQRAVDLRAQLGALARLDELGPELQPNSASLGDELFAWIAGPYRLVGDWIVLSVHQDPTELLMRAFRSVELDGVAPMDALIDALDELEVRSVLVEPLLGLGQRLHCVDNHVVEFSGGMGAISSRLLRVNGLPMQSEELAALIGAESLPSLRNQLAARADLTRVGIDRWALSDWNLESYEGIVPAMRARLEAAGSLPVAALGDELHEQYGVSTASIAILSSSCPVFVYESGTVRLRRADEPYTPAHSLEERADCRRIEGHWTLRKAIDRDIMRGSGTKIAEAFAVEIGIRPGDSALLDTPFGPVRCGWQQQPWIGSIRRVAERLAGRPGDTMLIHAMGPLRLDFSIVDSTSRLRRDINGSPSADVR